jgi:hypothetical protein
MDLATEEDTKQLIAQATKTKKCQSCSARFDFKNIRFYCRQSNNFFCRKCSEPGWVYENWQSEEKERLVCRSLAVVK